MKTFLQIILCAIAINCNSQIFSFKTEFQPSFIPSSILTIQDNGKKCIVSIKSKSFSEKCEINGSKLVDIINFLNHYKFKIKGSIDTLGTFTEIENGDTITYYSLNAGTDGIDVNGQLVCDKITKEFKFWSPRKGTDNDSLIVLLFDLMNDNLKNDKTMNYIEQLEQYFNFGLGVKKISENPLTFKLYGSISVNEESELNEFIYSLPKDKEIYFDMSNFNGMGTRFYTTFKSLCDTNKLIYWIDCSNGAIKQLNEIGIDKSRIKK
jgi:hypothetical protein